MKFRELALAEPLQAKLAEKNFEEPTPIQAETIPLALNNRDLIACAKTGSGKTLAFLLPMLQFIIARREKGLEMPQSPIALILAPTRELAVQISEEAAFFAKTIDVDIATIYGGVDHDKQRIELAKNPQIIVATPGRLLDFIESREIDLSQVLRIVLDEADRMLDMGFIDDIRKIVLKASLLESEERQFSLFSATINYSALYSVWEFMRDPEEIMINPELIDHANITQEILHLGKDEKLPYLIQFLEKNPYEPIIIFTNSRQFVDTLVKNLNHHSIRAAGLSSMVNQNRRLTILNDFKNANFRVLVATDVASRGLHIENIELVVNYDIPQDPETYVHRIGRTARAGKTGKAISISSEFDYDSLEKLERYLKYKIPVTQPDANLIENVSFVRIVSVDSSDGADHIRQDRRNERQHRSRDQRSKNQGRSRDRLASGGKHAQPRHHQGQPRPKQAHESGQAKHVRHDGRKPIPEKHLNHHSSRHPNEKHQTHRKSPPEFQIIQRKAQTGGFLKRVIGKVKQILGKKNAPEISERTRLLLEQESRSGSQNGRHKRPHGKPQHTGSRRDGKSGGRSAGRRNRPKGNRKRIEPGL